MKHQARPDGLCPKCKNAVSGAPLATPAASAPIEDPGDADELRAIRVAGVILLVNAVCVIIEGVMALKNANGAPSWVGAIFDLYVGGTMAAGRKTAHALGLVRIVLGAVVWGGLSLFKGEIFAFVLQVTFSGALTLLLIGQPKLWRVVTAATLAGLILLLEVIGLATLARGATAKGDGLTGLVRGDKFDYCMDFPAPSNWRMRDAAEAQKDNPLADRWLVDEGTDANLMVIPEKTTSRIDLKALEQVVMATTKANMSDVEQLPRPAAASGTIIHYRAKKYGIPFEFYQLVRSEPDGVYQILTFSTATAFEKAGPNMLKIIGSFQPHCASR